jgi:hypothetical protein
MEEVTETERGGAQPTARPMRRRRCRPRLALPLQPAGPDRAGSAGSGPARGVRGRDGAAAQGPRGGSGCRCGAASPVRAAPSGEARNGAAPPSPLAALARPGGGAACPPRDRTCSRCDRVPYPSPFGRSSRAHAASRSPTLAPTRPPRSAVRRTRPPPLLANTHAHLHRGEARAVHHDTFLPSPRLLPSPAHPLTSAEVRAADADVRMRASPPTPQRCRASPPPSQRLLMR